MMVRSLQGEAMSAKRIILTQEDHQRLGGIVAAHKRNHRVQIPQFRRFVRELERAIVLEPGEFPDDIVTLFTRVGYSLENSDEERHVTLVFPAQTGENKENISILSPLGLALIGERKGAELEYLAPGGSFRLTVRSVEHLHAETGVRQVGRGAFITDTTGYLRR